MYNAGQAIDEYGVAAAPLPLSTAYCQNWCHSIRLYSRRVRKSQVSAAYQDAQTQIKALSCENLLLLF